MALTSLLSRASLSALTTVSEPTVCSPPNRAVVRATGLDGPRGEDDRDGLALVEPERRGRDPPVLGHRDLAQLLVLLVAEPLLKLVLDLLAVERAVDEAGLLRLTRVVRRRVDERAHVLDRLAPRLCDLRDVAVKNLVEERVERVALALRHVLAREGLGRGLVLGDLVRVPVDAELVEGALEVHRLGRQPVDEEVADGGQVDALGRGRDVVLLVGAELHVGIDGLARLAEVGHRVAYLVGLGPARAEHPDVEEHRADPLVGLRLPQLQQEVRERVGLAAEEAARQLVGVGVVGQRALNLEDEHAVLGHIRLVFERHHDERHDERPHQQEHHQQPDDNESYLASTRHNLKPFIPNEFDPAVTVEAGSVLLRGGWGKGLGEVDSSQ